MVSGTKYPGNPVLQHGPAGSPDANRAQFYGSIIRIGEKFRMWYCAEDDATESIATGRSVSFRPAYAESTDGIHWTRPELGLVDYKGNTRNNLLHFTPKPDFLLTEPLYSSVLYEPDGPDPNKRYKMALYGRFYDRKDTGHTKAMSTIYPYFSADGLRWKLAVPGIQSAVFDETQAPISVARIFEIGGLYTFDGLYYAAGQELWPDIFMLTVANPDA